MIITSLLFLSLSSSLPADTNRTAATDTLTPVRDIVSQEAALDPSLAMGSPDVEPPDPAPRLQTVPRAWVVAPAPALLPDLEADTTRARPKAIEYSSLYGTRLTIHKYASYATIPLFVAEEIVGQKLYNGTGGEGLRGTHTALATGIGVLFGVNTITGAVEPVGQPEGSGRPNSAHDSLAPDARFRCGLPRNSGHGPASGRRGLGRRGHQRGRLSQHPPDPRHHVRQRRPGGISDDAALEGLT